jgi:hypothetical protein
MGFMAFDESGTLLGGITLDFGTSGVLQKGEFVKLRYQVPDADKIAKIVIRKLPIAKP